MIGFDKEKLLEVCKKTGAEVANFNSPEQIVITGEAEKVAVASKMISEAGAKRVIPLDVSGAFHSSLMAPAVVKFEQVLKKVNFRKPTFPVVSNVDGKPSNEPLQIQNNLAKQITSSVQWVDSIQFISSQSVEHFFEIGPGTVLKGLMRKINPSLKIYNIQKPEDIEGFNI